MFVWVCKNVLYLNIESACPYESFLLFVVVKILSFSYILQIYSIFILLLNTHTHTLPSSSSTAAVVVLPS